MFLAWREFRKGKRSKTDVQEFELHLEDNIYRMIYELRSGVKRSIQYSQFYITDPKPRNIHKTEVGERLIQRAIYRILMPLFDTTFIYDSYSCRVGKGTHKASTRLVEVARKQSSNYFYPCYSLKCDIKKFFHSVDHQILIKMLAERIDDDLLMNILEKIIKSFESLPGKGMPLGNLTSQLFANIYLDPLDKYIKHKLRVKYYLRYADDFVILGKDQYCVEKLVSEIEGFLQTKLKLRLRPDKISIRKLTQGIDFCGYVVLPHYTVLRTNTKRRMLKRVNATNLPSYLGLLKHCEGYTLEKEIRKLTVERV